LNLTVQNLDWTECTSKNWIYERNKKGNYQLIKFFSISNHLISRHFPKVDVSIQFSIGSKKGNFQKSRFHFQTTFSERQFQFLLFFCRIGTIRIKIYFFSFQMNQLKTTFQWWKSLSVHTHTNNITAFLILILNAQKFL
jgi:hypothetical protein